MNLNWLEDLVLLFRLTLEDQLNIKIIARYKFIDLATALTYIITWNKLFNVDNMGVDELCHGE